MVTIDTARTSRITAVVEPSCSLRISRKARAVSVASVWNRSPISSVGMTYMDAASEKTMAVPEMMPGMAIGKARFRNR